jgi:hypothetical protein
MGQSALQRLATLEKELARVSEGNRGCDERDEAANSACEAGEPAGLCVKFHDLALSWKF